MQARLKYLLLLFLAACGSGPTEGTREGDAARQPVLRSATKQEIAGCWNEVVNPRLGPPYPIVDVHCTDLCFSLVQNRFDQVVRTPGEISYKKRYDLFGLKWTETTRTKDIRAYGDYTMSKDSLFRDFVFPDPPADDTTEIWKTRTTLGILGDTLLVAGHKYLRADSTRHCGGFWATFDPDPDPPSGGGGGDWDWD